jgi:hypothetical protein
VFREARAAYESAVEKLEAHTKDLDEKLKVRSVYSVRQARLVYGPQAFAAGRCKRLHDTTVNSVMSPPCTCVAKAAIPNRCMQDREGKQALLLGLPSASAAEGGAAPDKAGSADLGDPSAAGSGPGGVTGVFKNAGATFKGLFSKKEPAPQHYGP